MLNEMFSVSELLYTFIRNGTNEVRRNLQKKIENETIACMNNEDQLHILKSRHSCRRNISHSQFFLLIIINTSSVIEGKTNEDFLLDGNYTTHLETEDDNGRHNFN